MNKFKEKFSSTKIEEAIQTKSQKEFYKFLEEIDVCIRDSPLKEFVEGGNSFMGTQGSVLASKDLPVEVMTQCFEIITKLAKEADTTTTLTQVVEVSGDTILGMTRSSLIMACLTPVLISLIASIAKCYHVAAAKSDGTMDGRLAEFAVQLTKEKVKMIDIFDLTVDCADSIEEMLLIDAIMGVGFTLARIAEKGEENRAKQMENVGKQISILSNKINQKKGGLKTAWS